jgi:hypothetical protein
MASPPVLDETIAATVAAYLKHDKNQSYTASALGVSRETVQRHVRLASERGLLGYAAVLPGFVVKATSEQQDGAGNVRGRSIRQVREPGAEFTVPAGHVVKGVSALLDPEGRELAKWVKTRQGELDPLQVAASLREAFLDYIPAAPVTPAPVAFATDLLTLLPCNDWHIGMFGWNKEVGLDWDLKIAEDTIGRAVEDTMSRSQASGHCIVLGGGDLLHADNSENKTAKSGNVLQVDGRYQKVVGVATKLMVRTIEAALRRHGRVTVRILPGNHDEHSAVAVAYFLAAWFRNEPRVTVDLDPSLFFWFRFGMVLLGATHGHTVKAKDMASIMAHRRAKDWGETTHRFVHCFHVHHREVLATEGKGVLTEVHQAPIPQDAWHFGAGFLSGRSIKAITYHERFGWYGDVVTPIQDAEVA